GAVDGSAGADGGGGTGGSGGVDAGSGDFTISLSPSTILPVQGASASTTVRVAPQGGFAQDVTVTVAGLPANVTADPLTVSAGAPAGALALHASANAQQGGPTPVTVRATAGSLAHTAPLNVLVAGPPGSFDLSFGASHTGRVTVRVAADDAGGGRANTMILT